MSDPIEVEYSDGSKETLTWPTEEEFKGMDDFHEAMMKRFFPDGIPLAEF
jgi:hypothetical protein